MTRRLNLMVMSALMVCIFGCSHDPARFDAEKSNSQHPLHEVVVQVDPELLASLEYEEFSGTLHPGESGWLQVALTTWPAGSEFSLMVPAEAMPPTGESVEFTMRIPTQQSYLDHPELPLIVDLEPSNVQFLAPVTIMCTYMPWVDVSAEDVFNYWSIAPEFEFIGPAEVFQVKSLVRLMLQVQHFSVWGAGNGDGSGED